MMRPSQRLRAEDGFGLVELMISLVVLNVGILAVVAAFNSGALALLRATETSTAAVLGDKQMELYRAIKYDVISLNTTAVDGTYTGDVAYPGTRVTGTCTAPVAAACIPTQNIAAAASPDGRPYRIDTFIITQTPANGRPLKRVTVVVRKPTPLTTLFRVTSNIDQSTG
jgi:Tfp pilus assembly protein PilV